MPSFNNTVIHPPPANSSSLSPQCNNSKDMALNQALSVLFLLVFPCALILNGVAAYISLQLKSTSTFILYLKNLVAADLLMTLTLPFMAASLHPEITKEFRAFTCRYTDVVFYCSMYTSISLMGLISLDRFFKIVKPCGKNIGQNVLFSQIMSSSVWLLIFGGTCIPTIVLTNQPPPKTTSNNFCMDLKDTVGLILHGYVVAIMEVIFWVVFALIVFCYIFITAKVLQSFHNSGSNNSQGKKKTKLRVFLILLVFFICFVPLHVMRIPTTLHKLFEMGCLDFWIDVLDKLALWLSTTNAVLDPLLYIFLCREYKNKLVDMMKARRISFGWCLEE